MRIGGDTNLIRYFPCVLGGGAEYRISAKRRERRSLLSTMDAHLVHANPAKGDSEMCPLCEVAGFRRVQFPRGRGVERWKGQGQRRGIKGYPCALKIYSTLTIQKESPWGCPLPEIVWIEYIDRILLVFPLCFPCAPCVLAVL